MRLKHSVVHTLLKLEAMSLSGKDYGEVLKEMMSQIGDDVKAMRPTAEESPHTNVETTVLSPPYPKEQQTHISFSDELPGGNGTANHVQLTNENRTPSLSLKEINPPDIQKVVAEHIVRRQDVVPHMQSQVRLRFLRKISQT